MTKTWYLVLYYFVNLHVKLKHYGNAKFEKKIAVLTSGGDAPGMNAN